MSRTQKLYCPKCGNYLETSSGDCADCSCGWRQETAPPSNDWYYQSADPDDESDNQDDESE